VSTAIKTKPSLWKNIVARVKAGTKGGNAGQWSNKQGKQFVSQPKAVAQIAKRYR